MQTDTIFLILKLFKLDIGITSDAKDQYFLQMIKSVIKELEKKGLRFEETDEEDIMLIVDYAVWRYKKRGESVEMPKNLQLRILNAKTRRRADG